MSDRRVSDFLLHCAQCAEAGIRVHPRHAPLGWVEYITLTLPDRSERWDFAALVKTRVLRFMLAAAIAKSEGR